LVNLLDDYDEGEITLTSAPDEGNRLWIEAAIAPQITISVASPDYIEAEKVPAIIIQGLDLLRHQAPYKEAVVNKGQGTAIVFEAPDRVNMNFELHVLAPGAVLLKRMCESVLDFFRIHRLLRATGTDELFQLYIGEEYSITSTPGASSIHGARFRGEFRELLFFDRHAKTTAIDAVYPILRVRMTGNANAVTPEPVI